MSSRTEETSKTSEIGIGTEYHLNEKQTRRRSATKTLSKGMGKDVKVT
jgi:hypothetical protein